MKTFLLAVLAISFIANPILSQKALAEDPHFLLHPSEEERNSFGGKATDFGLWTCIGASGLGGSAGVMAILLSRGTSAEIRFYGGIVAATAAAGAACGLVIGDRAGRVDLRAFSEMALQRLKENFARASDVLYDMEGNGLSAEEAAEIHFPDPAERAEFLSELERIRADVEN